MVAVVAYLFVYTRVTPHDEFQLIRDNDPAAAIALGLSLLGFVLPVVSAIAHSANVWDCLIWSVDRADRADHRLLHRQDTGAEPVGADRGRRTRRRDLARIVLTGRGRAQRRLHDLLTMATKPQTRSGNSARANRRCLTSLDRQPGPPAKRSGHVALLLMGTFAVGGAAYTLMPRDNCERAAERTLAVAAAKQRRMPAARILLVWRRPWSAEDHRGASFYSSDSSSNHSASGTSSTSSGGVTRGGFGSFAHAFGFSGG